MSLHLIWQLLWGWAGIALALDAEAGDWQFTPRLSTTQTLSDNVLLSKTNRETDLTSVINSGGSLVGSGAHLNANIDYSLSRVLYVENSDFNRTSHQVSASALADVIEEFFTVSAQMSRSLQAVSQLGAQPTSFANATQNASEVTSLAITPRLAHRLGRFASLNADYTVGITRSDGSRGLGDSLNSENQSANFSVSSGPVLPRLPTTLSHTITRSTFDAGGSDTLKTTQVKSSFRVNRAWSVNGQVGVDDNSFRNAQAGSDGFSWQMGASFTPNSRASFSFGYGKRFFGDNYSFSADWRKRRFALRSSYNESVTTFATRQQALVLFPQQDLFGQPIVDPLAGANARFLNNQNSLVNTVSVTRTLALGASLNLRRSSLSVDLSRNRLDSLSTTNPLAEKNTQLGFIWRYSLTPTLSTGAFASITQLDSATQAGSNRRLSLGPDLSLRLSDRLSGSLRFAHTDSEGGNDLQEFEENSLVGSLTLGF